MTTPRIDEEPLDGALRQVLAQMTQAGAPRMIDGTPETARAAIRATAATCAPGPRTVTAEDLLMAGVPARLHRADGAENPGTVVHLHGGGWVTGDLDYADAYCRHLAERAGCAVLSVGYRLAPEHPFPAALDDAASVLHAVADGARGLGPAVVLSGDSAGGNLAAVCAAGLAPGGAVPGLRVLGQVLVYPIVDADLTRASYRTCSTGFLGEEQMRWFWGHYCADAALRADPRMSPLRGAAAPLPSVVAVGGHDPLRDEGLAYAEAVDAAGGPVEVLAFPALPHGFLQFTGVSAAAAEAQDRIVGAAARLCADVFAADPARQR